MNQPTNHGDDRPALTVIDNSEAYDERADQEVAEHFQEFALNPLAAHLDAKFEALLARRKPRGLLRLVR